MKLLVASAQIKVIQVYSSQMKSIS